jgi:hypothetical protein
MGFQTPAMSWLKTHIWWLAPFLLRRTRLNFLGEPPAETTSARFTDPDQPAVPSERTAASITTAAAPAEATPLTKILSGLEDRF